MENLNLDQRFAPIIIDKDVQCAPLLKSDFIRLQNYLHEFNAEIKNLAEFDGFLAVIAINPKSYYEEFLASIIYGVDFEKDEHKKIFKTKEQLDDFIDLFTRRILFLFEAIREYKLENMLLFDASENTETTFLWLRGAVHALMVFESDLIVFEKKNMRMKLAYIHYWRIQKMLKMMKNEQ